MVNREKLAAILLGSIILSAIILFFKTFFPRLVDFYFFSLMYPLGIIAFFIVPLPQKCPPEKIIGYRILPLFAAIFLSSGIINFALDYPLAIQSKYSYIQGKPEYIDFEQKHHTQTFPINGIEFTISKAYISMDQNKTYQITYLPHSKFVINIEEIP